MNTKAATVDNTPRELQGDFARESVEVFVHAAQVLGVPRSMGEIYGLLYASSKPLPMDAIIERLSMSKGSASQGLRWLRDIGAIQATYIAGDRRDHFVAETRLRKLAGGFLRDQIEPHLQSAEDRLERLEKSAASGPDSAFQQDRARKVRRWHRLARQFVPLFLRLVGQV